ncbi:MAG: AMP-dependent synthetase/ligase [Candidatus Acidiferrum sp.]
MPNFIENIFAQLQRAGDRVVLREVRGQEFISVTATELLDRVQTARDFLRGSGVQAGDRCALLAPNSILWVIADLALMAEGIVVVPLYSRQAPVELVAMMRDCQPRLILVGDVVISAAVKQAWPDGPASVLLAELISPASRPQPAPPILRNDTDLVTIIYTSGTSGESKGVCLNVRNITHMLGCTTGRLDQLMGMHNELNRIFHYLPFNFAASWIVLLSALSRESTLTLSTDLNRLADEIRLAAPHYFLNVPTLLERVRRGVEEALSKRGAPIRSLFAKAGRAWHRQQGGETNPLDKMWLALGRRFIFSKITARFGPHLRALICGSAPLSPETQQFFLMLGIAVLQGYGLTETTGICTLDDPRVPVEPGYVGPAISGIEMKVAESQEIVVRGPHIFPGYWNRPEESARVLVDGWFRTGDQGEMNARGNWRIIGRIKNLIILNSGHNIAPEPLEEKIAQRLPGAQQVVLVGNGRGYLCALLTGTIDPVGVQAALDAVNADLPHYRQVRKFRILDGTLTMENGLLTGNGKLRRDAISARFASEINDMYEATVNRQAAGMKAS